MFNPLTLTLTASARITNLSMVALTSVLTLAAVTSSVKAQAQEAIETSATLAADTPVANLAQNEELTLRASFSALSKETTRKFFGELYSLTFMSAESFKNKSGSPTAYNFVGAKWDFTEKQSLTLRQQFFTSYELGSTGASGQSTMSDLLVRYANGKVAEFGPSDDTTVSAIVKLELPTGENSRFVTKTQGALYTSWSLLRSMGAIDLSLNVDGALFNQSQDSHQMTDSTGQTNAIIHASWSYAPYVELDWNAAKKLTLAQTLGTENVFYRAASATSPNSKHFYSATTLVTYEPIKGYSIGGGFSNKVDIGHPAEAFQIMRDKEVTYLLELSAKI